MNHTAFKARVYGIVQGVGYRFFTRDAARRYGITGYVKNMPDGSVEVYAEGEKAFLEEFLKDLHQGPFSAVVEKVDVEWLPPKENLSDFSIRF
ncbi:MAG: acylphosphatase [Calditrichaeota bacterium]|nr:MAG: acylphosphatase [Calditrichota bacterium]